MALTPSGLALDELAGAVAEAIDDPGSTPVLRTVVRDLEHAAGAGLGEVERDPAVALARRFARAHRLLLTAPCQTGAGAPGVRGVELGRVRRHVVALQAVGGAGTHPSDGVRAPVGQRSVPVGV